MSPQVIIVTGAASGNGLAITNQQLSKGNLIVAFDTSKEVLNARKATDWKEYEKAVICVDGDVSAERDVKILIESALKAFGRINSLVNNAGITGTKDAAELHTTPIEEYDRVMAVNVRGVFLCTKAVLPHMLQEGAGAIVNIASVASLVAFPARAAYTASKGAVLQMTKSVALDYAKSGIRCNAVCPGMIETPMTQWRLDQPELREQILSRIPQRDIGKAGDVADAVDFLMSPQARYVNGSALVVDGALTAI